MTHLRSNSDGTQSRSDDVTAPRSLATRLPRSRELGAHLLTSSRTASSNQRIDKPNGGAELEPASTTHT